MSTQPPEREGAPPQPGGPQSPGSPQSPNAPQSPPGGGPQSPGAPASPGAPPQSPGAPAYSGPVPPGGFQQQQGLAPTSGALADWGPRAGATLLDFLLFFVVTFAINLLITVVFGIGSAAINSEGLAATGGLLQLVVAFVIYAAYTGFLMIRAGERNGQTLGKQVLGIRVVRVDGQPVTIGTVAIRHWVMKYIVFLYVAVFTLYIATLLNYLWPLWDKENRTFHDMAASTRVVRA